MDSVNVSISRLFYRLDGRRCKMMAPSEGFKEEAPLFFGELIKLSIYLLPFRTFTEYKCYGCCCAPIPFQQTCLRCT